MCAYFFKKTLPKELHHRKRGIYLHPKNALKIYSYQHLKKKFLNACGIRKEA
jgi:hypothetical protein